MNSDDPFVYVVNLVWDLLGSLMPLHSPHFVCKHDVGTIKAEVALRTVSEITQPVKCHWQRQCWSVLPLCPACFHSVISHYSVQ